MGKKKKENNNRCRLFFEKKAGAARESRPFSENFEMSRAFLIDRTCERKRWREKKKKKIRNKKKKQKKKKTRWDNVVESNEDTHGGKK